MAVWRFSSCRTARSIGFEVRGRRRCGSASAASALASAPAFHTARSSAPMRLRIAALGAWWMAFSARWDWRRRLVAPPSMAQRAGRSPAWSSDLMNATPRKLRAIRLFGKPRQWAPASDRARGHAENPPPRDRPLKPRTPACAQPSAMLARRPVDTARYQPIRFTPRQAEAGIDASGGGVGKSDDYALAASVIGLSKTEVIKFPGPR